MISILRAPTHAWQSHEQDTDRQTNELTGKTDRQTDGRMDGWTEHAPFYVLCKWKVLISHDASAGGGNFSGVCRAGSFSLNIADMM